MRKGLDRRRGKSPGGAQHGAKRTLGKPDPDAVGGAGCAQIRLYLTQIIYDTF